MGAFTRGGRMKKFLLVLFCVNGAFYVGWQHDLWLLIPLNLPIIWGFLNKGHNQ